MNRRIDPEDFLLPQELDFENKSYIYGEVFEEDIEKIIEDYNNIESFLDIGSGCGKLVVHIANKFKIMSSGVEINSMRHSKSVDLLDKFKAHLYADFTLGTFENIYFGLYDMIYCCNKVFNEDDNSILFNKLLIEFKGICIIFEHDRNVEIMKKIKCQKPVRTSWTKNETVYVLDFR